MLFNSLKFAVFFVIIYVLYLVLRHNYKRQNRMLLVASCIFYGAWDWRFLCLMFTSISVDYICALKIYKSNDEKVRKRFLLLSIGVNLLFLGFFKYFNFFASNLQVLLAHFGITAQPLLLRIILPVGISFYTFEAITYVFDVYRKIVIPTTSFRDYALFVTYFPHLVAGPIMRAKDLLPQIQNKRVLTLDKFYEGSHLIFWGLFQKVVIADNLANVVNPVFAAAPPYNGMKVLLALYAFAFQIYCDFAGYSNMARGLGKCMGFEIMVNFNLPYFVTNPSDFWKRWHISLSTWLRDYLYIPLGGSRRGTFITYRNLAITMLLGGLWHGAAWTYVIWGAYHGFLLMLHRAYKSFLPVCCSIKNTFVNNAVSLIKIIFFFHAVCLGWLLFRAKSMGQVFYMLKGIVVDFAYVKHSGIEKMFFMTVFLSGILISIQAVEFVKGDSMIMYRANDIVKSVFYVVLFCLMLVYGVNHAKEFIYFQF